MKMTKIAPFDFMFFSSLLPHVSETDYQQLQLVIAPLKAMTRVTHRSIYVLDYYRKNFLYVSPNPLLLCGMEATEVLRLGFTFYQEFIAANELAHLASIADNTRNFFFNFATEQLYDFSLSCNIHLLQRQGKPILVNHQLTPLCLTPDKKAIWLALGFVSLPETTEKYAIIRNNQTLQQWKLEEQTWTLCDKLNLKELERAMIRLASRGCTIEQIAEQVGKSPDTVKSYRRELFARLGVKNMNEAVTYCYNHKLL